MAAEQVIQQVSISTAIKQRSTSLMARSSALKILAKLTLTLERGFLSSTAAPMAQTVFISSLPTTLALLQQRLAKTAAATATTGRQAQTSACLLELETIV